jgi:hypothetical protein
MQVICLEKPAFFELIDKVPDYIKTTHQVKEDRWISLEEAMKLLHFGKTTLQIYRNEGRIRYYQADRKKVRHKLLCTRFCR